MANAPLPRQQIDVGLIAVAAVLLLTRDFHHHAQLLQHLQHQAEYYRRLSVIRTEGDWESWVSFFLEGVAVAAADAERNIIVSLIAADRRKLLQSSKTSPATYRLFELLPMMPRFTVERVRQQLETTFPTANAAVGLRELEAVPARSERGELFWGTGERRESVPGGSGFGIHASHSPQNSSPLSDRAERFSMNSLR